MPQIKSFKGLNNVSDPLRLGLGWLSQADNLDVTDTGSLVKRRGFSKVGTGSYTGLFTSYDFSRMYYVQGGALKNGSGVVLATGITSAPMNWTEVNEQIYFNNGINSGVIDTDDSIMPWAWPAPSAPTVRMEAPTPKPEYVSTQYDRHVSGYYQVRCTYVLPDGRETGSSDAGEATGSGILYISNIPQLPGYKTNVYVAPSDSAVYQLLATTTATAITFNDAPSTLGRELMNMFLDPLPQGCDIVQYWKGVMYAAQYLPTTDQTVIWFSEPLGYHLFNLNSNFFMVPGHVYMLATNDATALLIGTDSRVFAYDGQKIEQIAPYGVLPGVSWVEDEDEEPTKTYFWTTRGLCSALPFTNLTERQVSMPPGVSAGGTIVRSGGKKRYVVALRQGGAAFNPYS